jgi:hypothetical protein
VGPNTNTSLGIVRPLPPGAAMLRDGSLLGCRAEVSGRHEGASALVRCAIAIPDRLEREYAPRIEARVLKAAGYKVSRHKAPYLLERMAEAADRRLARRVQGWRLPWA